MHMLQAFQVTLCAKNECLIKHYLKTCMIKIGHNHILHVFIHKSYQIFLLDFNFSKLTQVLLENVLVIFETVKSQEGLQLNRRLEEFQSDKEWTWSLLDEGLENHQEKVVKTHQENFQKHRKILLEIRQILHQCDIIFINKCGTFYLSLFATNTISRLVACNTLMTNMTKTLNNREVSET